LPSDTRIGQPGLVAERISTLLRNLERDPSLPARTYEFLLRVHHNTLCQMAAVQTGRPSAFRWVTPAASKKELTALAASLGGAQHEAAIAALHGPAILALSQVGVLRSELNSATTGSERPRILAAAAIFVVGEPCPMRGKFDDDRRSRKPPDYRSRGVARLAAAAYRDLTGRAPGRIVRSDANLMSQKTGGPFVEFLTRLLAILGIKASAAQLTAFALRSPKEKLHTKSASGAGSCSSQSHPHGGWTREDHTGNQGHIPADCQPDQQSSKRQDA